MLEKFDFTKQKDVKKFEKLPKNERDRISNEAQVEAYKIENIHTKEALKRIEKMPEGFLTNGLMCHHTRLKNLEEILKEGILSPVEQFKAKGKINKLYDPVSQKGWGAFDYVSVFDPWYGANTANEKNEMKKQAIRKEIYNEIEQYLLEIEDEPDESYDEKLDSNKYLGYKFMSDETDYLAILRGETIDLNKCEKEEEYSIPLKSALNKKWDFIFKKINKIFEDYSKVEFDLNKKTPDRFYLDDEDSSHIKKFNLTDKFVSLDGVSVILNPKLERFTIHSVGRIYYGESFLKNRIKPDDILGVVIPTQLSPFSYTDNFERKNISKLFFKIKDLCMTHGIPIYEVETEATQNEITIKGKIELIWPKVCGRKRGGG